MAGVVGIGTARSSTYLIIISIIPKFMLLVTINSLRAEVSVRRSILPQMRRNFMTGNREYKSDVFSMLMQDKENALQLYNAVNGSAYTDSSMVEICTLDKGISLSVRNDASFILDSNLSIYEHQSTVCPNMPVRNLIYFTTMVERMVKGHNIYGMSCAQRLYDLCGLCAFLS